MRSTFLCTAEGISDIDACLAVSTNCLGMRGSGEVPPSLAARAAAKEAINAWPFKPSKPGVCLAFSAPVRRYWDVSFVRIREVGSWAASLPAQPWP